MYTRTGTAVPAPVPEPVPGPVLDLRFGEDRCKEERVLVPLLLSLVLLMMWQRYVVAAAALPLVGARVVELTGDNFDRLVFERNIQGPAFVKFYAPWCQHCQKLAPDWKKVEKPYADRQGLLVGSVDCADGPKGRNPLCDKYKAMSLPTLLYFNPPSKKASHYDGNKTAEALLEFAAELDSKCSLEAQDECTDEQRALVKQYDAMPLEELKSAASTADQEGEMARMKMMMAQMQMQETYKDQSMAKEAKDAKMEEYGEQAKAANEEIEAAWAKSAETRAMKLVLRAKAKDDEDWDFDPTQMMMNRNKPPEGMSAAEKAAIKREKAAAKLAAKKKARMKREMNPNCVDGGPWPCTEEGCPSPSVTCTDLKDDCKRKFSAVFSELPDGLGKKARVWEHCRKTCDRCGDKDEV